VRHALVIILLVVLMAPCLADERVLFLVDTDPPGALVTDQFRNELLRSGTEDYINTSPYGDDNVEFTVELEGYKTQTFYLRKKKIGDKGRYPEEGLLVLEPLNKWVPIKRFFKDDHPWAGPLILALLAAAGIGAVRVRSKMNRQRDRLNTLAHFESSVSQQGSLLMHTMGGYRLVDVLGKGGMATVYRGVPDNTLKASDAVAVKVLSKAETSPEDFVERFNREVRTYIQLTHPNIVKLIDWGEHEGWTYLVLELVDGEDLGKRASTLSRPEVLEVLGSVMQAMAFAHAQGVVHRDLKPENIMLTREGRVMVMDFGLARKEDAKRITQTGAALGTPAYMAPEQIQAGPLDPRSDQYGLGVMAYELLTGKLPFDHDDPLQVIFSHLSQPRPNPCEINNELPAELGEVITRMMAIEPDDRYPTLVEAHAAFLDASCSLVEMQKS
jgi:predicted Ser/Thr protein kinase